MRGKPFVTVDGVPRNTEHPRACGENSLLCESRAGPAGTSPRMRGKRQNRRPHAHPSRNIPAHAGKTPRIKAIFSPSSEHPRACGENLSNIPCGTRRRGTSPRMRGKRSLSFHRSSSRRNIPAHAGKTSTLLAIASLYEEHPRACGENFLKVFCVIYVTGTSPRMRGKPQAGKAVCSFSGNIPAHAGKTPYVVTVHSLKKGTSPRMRGKLSLNQAARLS